MKIENCNANDLTTEQLDAWQSMLAQNPHLDSAFYRPELTMAVARARDDVQVATVRDKGEIVAFFPYQRTSDGCANSITGRLSEFHGVVSAEGLQFDPEQMIRECGLRYWLFDHVPAAQASLAGCAWRQVESPYMDLRTGFDGYVEAQRERGSSAVKQAQRKMRKLEREVGTLRFEWNTDDPRVWEALVQWKTEQHQRTKVIEIFNYPWLNQMMAEIRREQSDDFSAPVSALYAGDRLVAIHFGLVSRSALHIWFPTYNRDLQSYSPGVVLLLEMAREAAERGIGRIDFGKGEERYKSDFRSDAVTLMEGGVDFRFAMPLLRSSWSRLNQFVQGSRWRRQLEAPILATRRLRQWMAFR